MLHSRGDFVFGAVKSKVIVSAFCHLLDSFGAAISVLCVDQKAADVPVCRQQTENDWMIQWNPIKWPWLSGGRWWQNPISEEIGSFLNRLIASRNSIKVDERIKSKFTPAPLCRLCRIVLVFQFHSVRIVHNIQHPPCPEGNSTVPNAWNVSRNISISWLPEYRSGRKMPRADVPASARVFFTSCGRH